MDRRVSWSRLRESLRDAWSPVKGGWAVILKIAAGLALLGFGIGAYFEPDMLLPESTLAGSSWASCFS